MLHCFWGDVVEGNDVSSGRCASISTFSRKTWLHDRVIQRIDQLSALRLALGLCNSRTILSITSGASIPDREKTRSAGTYCHSEAHGRTIKVSDGY